MVDRHRQLGKQSRIAVGVAGDHAADTYPLGPLSDGGLQRPALIHGTVGPGRPDRGEVVKDPDMVEAGLVRDAPDIAQRPDRRVLAGVF